MKLYQPTNIMLNFLKRFFLGKKEEIKPIETYEKYNYRIVESEFDNGTKSYSPEYQIIKLECFTDNVITETFFRKITVSCDSYNLAQTYINVHKKSIIDKNKKEIKTIIHEIK